MINYYYIVKPNHKLNYSIGTDFCLEETSFSFTIVCRLDENEPTPSPLPAFQWLTTFKSNETVGNVPVTVTVATHFDDDTLIFSGDAIAELDRYSVLNVTCNAFNNFGRDNATTVVKICGM